MCLIDNCSTSVIVGSPTIGTAGFVGVRIKNQSTKKILDIVRESASKHQGCPINKNIPTKVTRKSFKRSCRKFKSESLKCSKGNGGRKYKHSQLTGSGFINIHHRTCIACDVGKAIEEGTPYEAPPNIEFVTRFTK